MPATQPQTRRVVGVAPVSPYVEQLKKRNGIAVVSATVYS